MGEPKPPEPGLNTERSAEGPLTPSKKNQRIYDIFSKLQMSAFDMSFEKMMDFQEKVAARAQYLKGKYPDWEKRAVYHILSGSGMSGKASSEVIEEDFPEEDSIEKFLSDLEAKYKS